MTKEGLAALPSAFTAARLQDAVAAVDITESGFGGTKSRSGASEYGPGVQETQLQAGKIMFWCK